ncbi:hypothetical protein K4L44_15155 [Halosquirtibacter laminarini]|uniref:Uncharacterized protein n=1 Tax=Halosquirtibacter laminarini TaxID=3374600 RepID=A0AC61NEB7_9BACT|nr:hypothetical protein K4L44_15155 [Prolixibacteraceae bacterium]
MKQYYWIGLVLMLFTISCKTTKHVAKENVQTTTITEPNVEEPVLQVKEEKVVAASGEDQSVGNFKYYIIWGSFQNQQNAIKFKANLVKKYDAEAFILVNEEGWFRVCFESHNIESNARSRVHELRKKYTDFATMWLLINKQ